jgi:hypothetical protein
MQRPDRWVIVFVALLVAAPAVGEPIRLTSGFLLIDYTESGFPADFGASGPGTELRLFGTWTDLLRPSRVDGFIDPSFSGVFEFEDEESFTELQLGDRVMNFGGRLNVSVTGPRVPIPPPSDEFGSTLLQFSGLFEASFSGLTSEGEFLSFDISEPGGALLFFGLPPTPGSLALRETSAGFRPSAPVTEPGTIILLSAGGLVGLAKRRRMREQSPSRDR